MTELYPVFVALIFNGIDILSGLVSAAKTKSIQSSKLRDGLFKRIGFVFCYALAFIIDKYGAYFNFNLGVSLLPIIVVYVVGTEITSIIENICIINPDLVHDKLKEIFDINKGKEEK